jgi:hypothetical protein
MSKRTCSVDGCDSPYHAHGLCGRHCAAQRYASPEGRAKSLAWHASPAGRASHARSKAAYRASPEGQQAEAAYRASAKRKAALMKYTAGEKFKTQQARYRATSRGKASTKRSVDRYRAQKAGVRFWPMSLAELVERDNGTCQLCGQVVRADAKFPHPMSPSVDHIVPLSLGGPHIAENLQLAHLVCNIRKGNRVA